IRRCGQAGIAGQKGATRCLVAGNLIEDINYRREFGGWETAAIKFHESVDTVIAGNLIRRVDFQSHGAFGIWMDWGNQGTRITGNIIYDTKAAAVFLEMDHGPILVDNNVVIGQGVRSNSEGTTFAHNLFADCAFEMVSDTERQSQYYRPHTRTTVERKSGVPQDDKWYNNIFIRRGLEKVKEAPGYASDGNLFLEGAGKSAFGDAHSVVDPLKTDFHREETPVGATFTFAVGKAALGLRGPRVDAALVGVLPTVKQTIEDRYGKAISVDTDIQGLNRQDRVPGPVAGLKPEGNTIAWSLEPARPDGGKAAP
ncbi:MAG TPA: right-handed parallel beta-helix repeat-containing protein, partial [Phycisphaerae bacterium]|nr:right-handed parallel beta-helix repeat-containing protein [Phycisphaerae bacterium]